MDQRRQESRLAHHVVVVSGNWPEPAAKHPTPQFVLDAGAVTVRSESSKTDIPLFWDPVYRKHANRFLAEVAQSSTAIQTCSSST